MSMSRRVVCPKADAPLLRSQQVPPISVVEIHSRGGTDLSAVGETSETVVEIDVSMKRNHLCRGRPVFVIGKVLSKAELSSLRRYSAEAS